ncbi:MAG: hypothetical protein JSW71_04350, partial [Gemmatimonadota bacterium]
MHRWMVVPLAVAAVGLWFVACADDPELPVEAPQLSRGRPTPSDAELTALIRAVLPTGLEQAALSRARNVERETDAEEARSKLFELIEWLLQREALGQLEEGVTAQDVADLLSALYPLAGLPAPEIPEGALTEQGAAQVVYSTGAVVQTGDQRGAVEVLAGSLEEPTLVVMERLPDPVLPTTGPLPTNRAQYPLFFGMTSYPAVEGEVTIDACQVKEGAYSPPPELHDEEYDELRLAREDPAAAGTIELLPRVPIPAVALVECEGTALGSGLGDPGWLERWGEYVLEAVLPQRLAADGWVWWSHSGLTSSMIGLQDTTGAVGGDPGPEPDATVFESTFDGGVVGDPPGKDDPEVGLWLQVDETGGTIRVEESAGSMGGDGDQVVVLDRTGSGALRTIGAVSGEAAPDAGVYVVRWRSVVTAGGYGGGVSLHATDGKQLAIVEYEPGGSLDINGVPTQETWTVGEIQEFALTLDLDDKQASLTIDGEVVDPEPFAEDATNL